MVGGDSTAVLRQPGTHRLGNRQPDEKNRLHMIGRRCTSKTPYLELLHMEPRHENKTGAPGRQVLRRRCSRKSRIPKRRDTEVDFEIPELLRIDIDSGTPRRIPSPFPMRAILFRGHRAGPMADCFPFIGDFCTFRTRSRKILSGYQRCTDMAMVSGIFVSQLDRIDIEAGVVGETARFATFQTVSGGRECNQARQSCGSRGRTCRRS